MTQPVQFPFQDAPLDNGPILEDAPIMAQSPEWIALSPITAQSPEWIALRTEVNFIYAFMTGFAAALGKMSENPMMRTMGRQFGMDLDVMKGLVPPTNGD